MAYETSENVEVTTPSDTCPAVKRITWRYATVIVATGIIPVMIPMKLRKSRPDPHERIPLRKASSTSVAIIRHMLLKNKKA